MKRFFPAPHALLTLLLVCVGMALACALDFDNVGPLDSDALLEADETGDAQDILSGPVGDAEEDGIPVLAGPAGDAEEDGIPVLAGPAGDAEEDGMAGIPPGPAGDAEEDGIPVLAGPAVDAQEGQIGSAMPLQASPDTAPGDNE